MKKLAAIALAILMMAAVAAGCGGDNGATDATNASTEKPTNSVKVPTKETDETDESDAAEEESTDAQEDEQGDNSADDEEENQPASTQSQVQETEPPYVAPDTTEAPYVEPEPTDPPVQGGTFTSSDAYFSYNGVTISIGADINNIVAAIGNPSSKTEANSCYGEGKDIAYHYGDLFTINTIPSNGVNIVNTVSVNSTPKGVSVGQSESAIVNAYGNSGKVSDYLYSFSNGGTLNFYLSGGTITAIEYC